MAPQHQFQYSERDEESQTGTDRYRDRDAAMATVVKGPPSVLSVFGCIFNTATIISTTYACIAILTVKTRVQTPGGVNIPAIAIGKLCASPATFLAICALLWQYKGQAADAWPKMVGYAAVGIANIIFGALTFTGVAQGGDDGIVGTKVTDKTPFEYYDRKGRYHDQNGWAYYNSDKSRRALVGAWITSGVFESLVGIVYLAIALLLIHAKWLRNRT